MSFIENFIGRSLDTNSIITLRNVEMYLGDMTACIAARYYNEDSRSSYDCHGILLDIGNINGRKILFSDNIGKCVKILIKEIRVPVSSIKNPFNKNL